MKQYRILMVGGFGAVGSELSKQLSDDGHSVRATTTEEVTQKAGGKVEQGHVDLLTGEGMTNAFEGIDRALFDGARRIPRVELRLKLGLWPAYWKPGGDWRGKGKNRRGPCVP